MSRAYFSKCFGPSVPVSFYAVLSASLLAACSAGTSNPGESQDEPVIVPGDGDGDFVITPNDDTPAMSEDPRVQNGIPVREEVCDQVNTCTCLRLALVGTLTSEADDTDTSAFVNWLNGNTDGTASVTMVSSKPTMDEEWLNQFDILVLANLNGWSFSTSEREAVAQWSARGGGILAITGFESTASEAASSSALLQFSGVEFQGTSQSEWTAPQEGQSVPVYLDGGMEDMRNCLRWTENNQAGNTTPIRFMPQSGALEPLTFQLDYVGAYIGWSVTSPPDATVLARDPVTGRDMAVAYEHQGAGRVVAFGDEWIIFANQWEPKGQPHNRQMDEYNPCYIPPAESGTGQPAFHSVATVYQTKQFWYNAINWVAPPNECNFVVVDDDVVIR